MRDESDEIVVDDRAEWRRWLASHHDGVRAVWLVINKKGVREDSMTLAEAVEEALCFGWIDGKSRTRDDTTYRVRFTPRKAGSVWSFSNIRRVAKLSAAGLMTEAGLDRVREARRNGQWDAAIERERTDEIPPDLANALRRRKGAIDAYRRFTIADKKRYLYWLSSAKRPETRRKRIDAIVETAVERCVKGDR